MGPHVGQSSVLCPELIGRSAERARLWLCLDRAAQGQGQIAALSGEAGIGKSRLARDARDRAPELNYEVLEGRCFESDRDLPYAPLLDLLRSFLSQDLPAEAMDGIQSLAPDLASLAPDLAVSLPFPADLPAQQEPDKRRLFQAIDAFLTRRAAHRPVLIIVEDLHWCDEVSLEFVLYLARQMAARRLFLLLTYRSEEFQPALASVLAELERRRQVVELRLAGLSRTDFDAMLAAIFRRRVPHQPGFVDALFELTEGNPFFVEEVLQSLVTADDLFLAADGWQLRPAAEIRIPRTIQLAVQRRLDPLRPMALRFLTLAAVAGRRFDLDLLQHVLGLPEAELLDLLRGLIEAQLVVEESASGFAFRHALTRQAVYQDLLARERRSLHRQLAEALQSLPGAALETHLSDLALHAYLGEVWPEALDANRRASAAKLSVLLCRRMTGTLTSDNRNPQSTARMRKS